MDEQVKKKAELERQRKEENGKKVGFEKLREKLEAEGLDTFITDVRDTARRVYCMMNTLLLEDVEIVSYAVDIQTWVVSANFRIKDELHPFNMKLSTLYELDMQLLEAVDTPITRDDLKRVP